MTRIHPLAFLAGGALLLSYGLNAGNSLGFTAQADETIWLIVAGVLGILAGTYGFFSRNSQ